MTVHGRQHSFASDTREVLMTKSGNSWSFVLWTKMTDVTAGRNKLDEKTLTGKFNRLGMTQRNHLAVWLKHNQAGDLWAAIDDVIADWSPP